MEKKILSLFCSGLMFFANAPCCAAIDAKLENEVSVADLISGKSLLGDISIQNDDTEDGPKIRMSIAQKKLTLKKTTKDGGGYEYTGLSSNDLEIPITLSYISNSTDNSKDSEIKIQFDIVTPKIKTDNGEDKYLNYLKGLNFELVDKEGIITYLEETLDSIDYENNKLVLIPSELGKEFITLSSSENNKELILHISKPKNDPNGISLAEAIWNLAYLESQWGYRFQIRGTKYEETQ